MGLIANYSCLSDVNLKELKAMGSEEEEILESVEEWNDDDELLLDIDKMWDVLHFVLTGVGTDHKDDKNPLSQAVLGVMAVEDISDYVAYTEHNHLANIVAALDQFDIESALESFDMKACKEAELYPNIWDYEEEEEEIKDEILHDFEQMKRFYKQVLEMCIRDSANIGSLINPTKIANSLTSAGRKVDNKTVERYLRGLEDSLLLYNTERFDVRGKELLRLRPKYYVVDMAFRQLLLPDSNRDRGHVLENIVYLELRRRGYTVYVGQLTKGEIDFVAQKPGGILEYYQVSESVLDPTTRDRELAPLEAVKDQYPKFLLTMDELYKSHNYNGIQQCNVLDWLLGM